MAITKLRWKSWLVAFGCWTAAGLLFGGRYYAAELHRGASPQMWRSVGVWMVCFYLWMPFAPAIARLADRFPFERRRWPGSLAVHTLAAVLLSLTAVAIDTVLYPLFDPATAKLSFPHLYWLMILGGAHLDFLIYWIILAVYYAVTFRYRYQQRELQAAQLENSLKQARLDGLRMQLNPHFLFNTLNTIGVLMTEDTAGAYRMLLRLSDLLRVALRKDWVHEVALRQELDFLRSYLEIEQTRYQNRLCVRMNISPDSLDAMVPTLMLQPLVENAIRHGIARRSTPGTVVISSTIEDATVQIRVTDDGPGLSNRAETNDGVGLRNTRERLASLYPHIGSLRLSDVVPSGVSALITIPYRDVSSAVFIPGQEQTHAKATSFDCGRRADSTQGYS